MTGSVKSILIFFSILSLNSYAQYKPTHVLTGADILLSGNLHLIKNKNIGIVTNQTAVLANGTHLVDSLLEMPDIKIKCLFSPEHGIRGTISAGETILDGKDIQTGIPLHSLYGKNKKPTREMLNDIDILIFDIQDVGSRYYSYISTLYYVIEASVENDLPLIVLDRPNPIGGLNVEGPILKYEYKSFVGIAPLPIRHGMTIGELALYFNHLIGIEKGKNTELSIIKMEGWQREYFFDDCDLHWIKPSPNMTNLNTAIVYPGMCLLEGTNISEGRGTNSPFVVFGAPFIDPDQLSYELNKMSPYGIEFDPVEFTPRSIVGLANNPKYENDKCMGLKLIITNREEFNSVNFGVTLLSTLYKLYPENFKFKYDWISKLFGDGYLTQLIMENIPPSEIISKWQAELEKFKLVRKEYLLY